MMSVLMMAGVLLVFIFCRFARWHYNPIPNSSATGLFGVSVWSAQT